MTVKSHFDVAIMQPGYLPWLGYFDLVAMADMFVIYDDVQFNKGSWRNRNRILGAVEPLYLTAPVRTAGKLGQRISDTELSGGPWQQKHLKSIRQCYRHAPFFDWCFPVLDRYLGSRRYHWLLDLNLEGHAAFAELFNITTPIRLSSEMDIGGVGRTERLVAIAGSLGATRYISADASKVYMEEKLWANANIELVYQNYPHPMYRQFAEPFQSHLAAVDALMFAGPDARSFVGISHSKERGQWTQA
jgi:hypothetical protein